jgi:hypothetical protein
MLSKLRVLFIGNSYIYFNNVPHLLSVLADRAPEQRRLDTKMIVRPGFTLGRHWADGAALSAIDRERWDYVILQEQSTFGDSPEVINGIPKINAPTVFHEYARQFDAAINKRGARTTFFLTWAREDSPESQALLNDGYLRIAKELRALVAPVGIAWRDALRTNASLPLYQTDHAHPAVAGSYLAACVLYSTLYGRSPEGALSWIPEDSVGIPKDCIIDHDPLLAFAAVDIGETDARFLQKIAWHAVKQLASVNKSESI